MISVADPPTTEKPPEYDTVCIVDPPCYDDAIKLNPANLLQTKYYQDVSLPNYNDLEISGTNNITATTTTNCSNSSTTRNDQENSQSNTVETTRYNTNNSQIENVTNRNNAFIAITIEQSASNSSNENSITQKTPEYDSVASQSNVTS